MDEAREGRRSVADEALAPEPEALVCMKDDAEVDARDPRCLHPSSRCRFREWCVVKQAIRRRAR